ncbi:hypothetical protein [Aureimonas populi]|uniref:Uncharacterized protein n=1 Tax=Aureimonas populi TaxID=1701758 RepID=A0ABW5CKS9_9HYPH|nr:hypothetical protein [Aureimonas populi]
MTRDPNVPGPRRARRGLVIEGEIVARAGKAPAPRPVPAPDLAARLGLRPYQSLLDDAMRLARRCRPMGTASSRV